MYFWRCTQRHGKIMKRKWNMHKKKGDSSSPSIIASIPHLIVQQILSAFNPISSRLPFLLLINFQVLHLHGHSKWERRQNYWMEGWD